MSLRCFRPTSLPRPQLSWRRAAENSLFPRLLLLLSVPLFAPCVSRPSTLAVSRQQSSPTIQAPGQTRQTPAQAPVPPPANATPAQSPTPQVRPRRVAEEADQTASPTASATPSGTPTEPASPAPADDEGIADDDDEVVRINSNLVIVPASVVDARGRAVTDLKLEDFELRVDGELKAISDLSRAATPVYITLLFDNSASLSQARAFEKEAAVRFLRSIVRPIDRTAIYSVATSPLLEQPFTNDVQKLVRTIEHFGQPEGATALFDAIAQASHYLNPLVGRKVIVIVSDGTDTISDLTFEQAVQRALRADCQVYVVQTRQIEDPTLNNPVAETQLAKLTEQTGGAVYVPKAVAELDDVFAQIARDLSQQYLLSYYPQDNRKDKFFRFIDLRVKSRPQLRVRARKGFFPNETQNQTTLLLQSIRGQERNTGSALSQSTPASEPGSSTVGAGNQTSTARTGMTVAPATRNENPTLAQNIDTVEKRKAGPAAPDDEAPAKSTKKAASDDESSLPQQPSATRTRAGASPDSGSKAAPASGADSSPPPRSSSDGNSSSLTTAKADKSTPPPAANGEPETVTTTRQPESETKTPVSVGVLNSKATYLPKPIYPQAAKSTGASGKVIVEVTIDEKGKVIAARAVSGPMLLQSAAVSAARQAKFSPTVVSGEAVRVVGTISYTFVWP